MATKLTDTELDDAVAAVVEEARRQALVQAIGEVHASGAYRRVWEVAQLHQGPYEGPKYETELITLE